MAQFFAITVIVRQLSSGRNFLALVSVAAIIGSAAPIARAQGITEIIAITGNPAPDGNGTLALFFGAPVLNDTGQVAFRATLTGTASGEGDNTGIFRGAGGPLTQIAREAPVAFPAHGLTALGDPALNDAGHAAFTATFLPSFGGVTSRRGIFRGYGEALTTIALEGDAAPGGNGMFASFGDPSLNDVGTAAFKTFLTGTSGGASDDNGIFRGSGGGVTQIAREGQAAPVGTGAFSSFIFVPALNLAGQVAFVGELTGTSDSAGIFRGAGGMLIQIARAGQPAPDGNGRFSGSGWHDPALNDAGQVAFRAPLTGTSGGTSEHTGIFRGTGGALTQIARAGQTAPDGNGVISELFTQR